jgi:DNA-binding MarR family transcriptional regulator
MDLMDLRTLKLLEEIEKGRILSQRDLAKILNISLGLVNLSIKKLVKKGYFMVTIIPKNRFKYTLTAKGEKEKTRLANEFMKHSFEFYKSTKKRLQIVFKMLIQQGIRRIAFFGAGDLAEIAYIALLGTSIDMVAMVDDDHIGQSFLGMPILSSSYLSFLSFDRILITKADATTKTFDIMSKQGVPSEKVVVLS